MLFFNIKSYRLSNKSLNYETQNFFRTDLRNSDPKPFFQFKTNYFRDLK